MHPSSLFQRACQHRAQPPPSSKCLGEWLVHADFHGEASGETHSPLAAVSPYALEENTAVVPVLQELHTSTLYLSILSKKICFDNLLPTAVKNPIYVHASSVCEHTRNYCLSSSYLTNLLFTKLCGYRVTWY